LLTCIPSSPLINPQTNTVTTTTITPLPPPLLTTKSSTTTTTLAFGEENEAINVDLNELRFKLFRNLGVERERNNWKLLKI